MSASDQVRNLFAAERTLLAWVRTGIAIIGLGFVIARFGLFLRLASAQKHLVHRPGVSTLLGIIMVMLGAAAIAAATLQFVRFCGTVSAEDRPARYDWRWSVALACMLSLTGIVLGGYLALEDLMLNPIDTVPTDLVSPPPSSDSKPGDIR